MQERQLRAEAIAAAWPASAVTEATQAPVVIPALDDLTEQVESLAHVHPEASVRTAPSLARATLQDLSLVSVIPAPAPAPFPQAAASGGTSAAAPATVSVLQAGRDIAVEIAVELPARHDAVKRVSAAAPPAAAASRALLAGPPVALAAAATSGAAGAVAPLAATLVIAAACLLGMRWLGRPALDPVSWRSAILTLRLERPG